MAVPAYRVNLQDVRVDAEQAKDQNRRVGSQAAVGGGSESRRLSFDKLSLRLLACHKLLWAVGPVFSTLVGTDSLRPLYSMLSVN
jgi:hypothetical protein